MQAVSLDLSKIFPASDGSLVITILPSLFKTLIREKWAVLIMSLMTSMLAPLSFCSMEELRPATTVCPVCIAWRVFMRINLAR